MRVGPSHLREKCALCQGVWFDDALDLGFTPLANEFVTKEQTEEQEVFPLALVICRACLHVQIRDIVDAKRMFDNYVYATGTSALTVEHFRKQAETIIARLKIPEDGFIVEIGSNDGTLLGEFQKTGRKIVLGVDPAADIAKTAMAKGINTIVEFFTPELAERVLEQRGHASVVIANNVFAHAEDLRDIAIGVKALIGETGYFVFEVSYLMDMAEHLTFDTIYHEHFSYHALTPLMSMFSELDMEVFDAERIPGQVGRGSLRVYVAPASLGHIAEPRLDEMVGDEAASGIWQTDFYRNILKTKIELAGNDLKKYLDEMIEAGVDVVGYGAPAKLTTLMYSFGLERRHAGFIVDDSPWKQGLYTPGLHIPVVPSSELTKLKPGSVVVVYAWNFADDIIKRFSALDVTWIVPAPKFRRVVVTEHGMET